MLRSTRYTNAVCSRGRGVKGNDVKTQAGHLQFNVENGNLGFYKDLFGFLGWETLYEGDGMLGQGNGSPTSLWFSGATNGTVNDHDGAGLNHFGLNAESVADVDAAASFLQGKGVELLYDTPCNRPEYTSGEDELYYSIMFLSPDQILFEVVYTGPR